MTVATCTLCEGDYHLGAGALANSLCASGYRGSLWVGYRGTLPPWAERAERENDGRHALAVSEGFTVKLLRLETTTHFAYFKAEFIERLLDELSPEAEVAVYFDPDIVVKCPWEVFTRWVDGGVALVEDLNCNLPARHPQRIGWYRQLALRGIPVRRELDRYYNSGFVGVPRAQLPLVAEWRRMMTVVMAAIGGHHHIKFGQATDIFHSTDQDALNMALLANLAPINAVGPEGMDFVPGGHLLSHAAGGVKPWRGGFVRDALRGRPPGLAQKCFFDHAAGPIPVFPAEQLARLRRSLKLASLIGRFYRRA